jgi:type III secretory pathway component EscV
LCPFKIGANNIDKQSAVIIAVWRVGRFRSDELYSAFKVPGNAFGTLGDRCLDCQLASTAAIQNAQIRSSKLRTIILLVFSTQLIAACATQAQRQAESIEQTFSSAIAEGQSCYSAIFSDTAFSPLSGYIIPDISAASMHLLAKKEKATSKQVQAIFALHPKYQKCRKAFSDTLGSSVPTVAMILVNSWIEEDQLILDLVERKVTWGAYTHKMQQLGRSLSASLQTEWQSIATYLAEADAAERQQRQEALAAFANAMERYSQQQQRIDKIITTNCSRVGNYVNCMTY